MDRRTAAERSEEGTLKRTADIFTRCYNFTRAEEAKAAGLYPYFLPIADSEGTEVRIDGHDLVMLGSNNYLGLTHDPRVLEAAEKASRQYGSGCTGSRFLNGNLDLHEELEVELANLVGKEAALVFSTGFHVNLGVISSLIGRDDCVVIDKLDHASIVDGALLSHGAVYRFRHNDMADLEKALAKARGHGGGILVVVDGVFSMEGDLADLPAIVEIVGRSKARLMVDEAHSVGVMGATGAGTHEHFGVTDQVDLLMGTFSKSFASIGGFAAGDRVVIDYVKHHARSLIFSASLPPYAVATVRTCVEILREEPDRRERLWANARRLSEGLKTRGFNLGTTCTPIVPIIVGKMDHTFLFWKALFEGGVFTNPVIPPAVPADSCRIRTSLMATHTDEQIDRALDIIEKAGKKTGVIG
ncbi:MAG: aminotransferase class I/II-fold pyridoxal phosphate-dependent enzyme [Candidatus Eisenbacteria bacterium]|nr:aminotransferase class I/II-fold pyridoxal phosphate-dependent enzyme [Candidatus Latescibacterota bacterium]MBD3301686.1 aminotransferase class I/II-fold pyridoxal phosphate-dependent enzyme [Candidatus Eisenbacteria bacterium]